MKNAAEHRSADDQRSYQKDTTRNLIIPALVFILLGAGLRLWVFGEGRSLWLDEAMVALNIIHLPYSELFGPLAFNQFAPLGWLVIEKASLALTPNFEYSLRIPSLVFGVSSLGVFYFLARSTLSAKETLLALAMCAVSSSLIYYSAETKPYVLDLFFSTLLLLIAHRSLTQPAARVRLTLWLGLIGIACAVSTFGALLVLASTGLVLFAAALVERDRRWIIALGLTGILWFAAFGALYLSYYKGYSTDVGADVFSSYWSEGFAPAPLSPGALIWYVKAAHMLLNFVHSGLYDFLFVTGLNALLLGGAILVGAVNLARRQQWLALLLVGPILLALLAAALEAYPFMARFHLALAPALILLAAHGAGIATRKLAHRRSLFLAASVVLLVTPVAVTITNLRDKSFWIQEEIGESLSQIAKHRREGDLLLVTEPSVPAFLLYADQENLRGLEFLVISNQDLEHSCVARNVNAALPYRRAWWLISHESLDVRQNRAYLLQLSSKSEVPQMQSGPGTKLYKIENTNGIFAPLRSPACAAPVASPELEEMVADRAGLVSVGKAVPVMTSPGS